jgi:hypothetical protein
VLSGGSRAYQISNPPCLHNSMNCRRCNLLSPL